MAASTVAINGTAYRMQLSTDSGVSWDDFGELISAEWSRSMSPRDISTKFSAGKKVIAEGQVSGTGSFETLVTYDTDADVIKPHTVFGYIEARTSVKLRFTNLNAGDYSYGFDVYFTNMSQSGGVEDNLTCKVDFEMSGTAATTLIT
jgi:hypothetical protein